MSVREWEEFEAAMIDVTWVIKKVSDSRVLYSTPLKRCTEGSLDETAAKRPRILTHNKLQSWHCSPHHLYHICV